MKTGIELLQDLCDKVELLSRRFDVIEYNTKQILSRLNISEITQEAVVKAAPKISKVDQPVKESIQAGNSRVMSKLKKDGKMLAGVEVKIFNLNSDELIRETKTNRAGEWQCFLTPGQYRAEYFLKNMISSNVNFLVTPDQQLLHVAQPGV
jgi:hypothetical protein